MMRYAFHSGDAGLLRTLLDEWKTSREDLEKLVLKLEVSDDPELADDLYNRVHGIKRGSSFMGLDFIVRLCHDMETLLVAVREKNVEADAELIDHLLISADLLSHSLIRLARKVEEHDPATELVVEFDDERSMDEIAGKTNAILNKQKQRESSAGEAPSVESPASGEPTGALSGESALETGGMDSAPDSGRFHPRPEPPQKAALTPGMQSIRVSQDKLDKMMNMISELLIAKNAFMHIAAKLNVEYDLPEMSKEVKRVGASINRISDELQNAILSMRMIEVKTVFQKMPRIVRDISQSTGKKMELRMEGEHTEIDKTIVEQISDPIVHLIRNAADHGIESPEERKRKGKSETGKITLRAYHKNKHAYIEIEDDGKGMDARLLKQKAVDKGLISREDAENMTESQAINLIFLPGFSTAGQITEVSGRGVGMDIVKSNIEKINGSIRIDSEVDRGTKMVIQLPLTLAVSRGLTVRVLNETYIIPIDYISETVKIKPEEIHAFNGKYFAHLRGDVIGIEWLSKLFLLGERTTDHEELNTVIVSNGPEKFGLVVDKLKNEQEFVMKTLDGHLAGIPGISGSTLLGDGQVVLIVNPIELVQLAKK